MDPRIDVERINDVEIYTLTNSENARLAITSEGARIIEIVVPDSHGQMINVVKPTDQHIEDAEIWEGEIIDDHSVKLSYKNKTVTYTLTQDNVVEIYMNAPAGEAIDFKICINLNGNHSKSLTANTLYINSSKYLHDGNTESVKDSDIYDFTKAADITSFARQCHDITNYWLLNDWEEGVMNDAFVLASHRSGCELDAYTTLPVIGITPIMKNDDIDRLEISVKTDKKEIEPDTEERTQLIFLEFKRMITDYCRRG